MIGLPKGTVQVVQYQSCWPELFRLEATRIRAGLSYSVGPIEHVGSTAVPGMSAKPIIDIIIAVESLRTAHTLIPSFQQLGYEHRPNDLIPDRLFLVLGPATCRTHHLSLAEEGSKFWHEHLSFRDHLRTSQTTAADYSALKARLAAQFPNDRPSYTSNKDAFIADILFAITRAASSVTGLRTQ